MVTLSLILRKVVEETGPIKILRSEMLGAIASLFTAEQNAV